MALNYHKIRNGITLKATTAPGTPENGDVYYDSTANLFYFYQNGAYINIPTTFSSLTGTVTATQGGTGLNTSSSSGIAQVSGGTWSVSSTVSPTTTFGNGVVIGTGALSTSATSGFLYVDSCAGSPSGTPTSQTGTIPVVIDTVNNKFWFYNSGWLSISGGSSGSAWPTQFASSETQLTTALSNAVTAGGGVICLTGSFTITSSHTIPANTILVGQAGNSILTIGSGGGLTMASGAMIEYLHVTTALSSGTLITMSGNNCTMNYCAITVPATSTTVCVNVSGSSNLLFRDTFAGVQAPSTGVGIQYANGGINNVDQYCIFGN